MAKPTEIIEGQLWAGGADSVEGLFPAMHKCRGCVGEDCPHCEGTGLVSGLRISILANLAKCPSFFALKTRITDVSFGTAAHTGSAVGRLIELWHRNGETAEGLLAAKRRAFLDGITDFPKANFDSACKVAIFYACDPRNRGVVIPDSCEQEVILKLEPDPSDPVQKMMEIPGHVDQIRRESDGGLYVWDVKNGKPEGDELRLAYAWQLAAYAIASTEFYGETVLPGGIIRTQSYLNDLHRCPTCNKKSRKKVLAPHEAKVFYETPWSLEACHTMMRQAARAIARLRRGIFDQTPGTHCNWCPGGGPHRCEVEIGSAFHG